jgi:hypothetical protein
MSSKDLESSDSDTTTTDDDMNIDRASRACARLDRALDNAIRHINNAKKENMDTQGEIARYEASRNAKKKMTKKKNQKKRKSRNGTIKNDDDDEEDGTPNTDAGPKDSVKRDDDKDPNGDGHGTGGATMIPCG